MRTVYFDDGSCQFLFRGQSFESDKKVKKIQDGIVVRDVRSKQQIKEASKEPRPSKTEDNEQK